MGNSNIILPSWKKVMDYEKKVKVGEIKSIHTSTCDCGGFQTEFGDTLQRVVSNPLFMEMFEHMDQGKQTKLFKFLKERNGELYGKLDEKRKTLFLRVTGEFQISANVPIGLQSLKAL